MNGTLIPNTPVAVDFWKLRECPQARIFFLTHLHGDHIAGLTPSFNYPIYCSELTAKLLSHRHQIRENLIHPLALDMPHIIYLDSERREQMTVTLVDANHCPGAVMFLFEGYFGTILHTGDFRFHLPMIEEPPLNKYEGKIDVLYLDNTYCSPACRFPSRDEATAEIIDIIQAHPEHAVVIGLRSLGKETLLCKIAMTCQEWIYLPSKFYETLQLLNAPNVFQNNASDCRIRVEPFHKISNKFVDELNQNTKTIAILPTSIYCGIDARPFDNNDNVFVVPYSDHSSYTELMQFISFLKPCKILPVVSGSARGPFGTSVIDRADMSRFDKYLNVRTTTAGIQVPDTVMRFMKGRAFVTLENVKQGTKRKAKKQLRSGTMKFVKKGVEYEDSPEKSMHQQKSASVLTEDKIPDKQLKKTNEDEVSLTSKKSFVDIQKEKDDSDLTTIRNCRQDDAEDNSEETSHGDNDLNKNKFETVVDGSAYESELASSQGFVVTGDYNSVNEEIVASLGFEVDSDSSKSDNVQETSDLRKSDRSHTVHDIDENASSLDNKKVRRSNSPVDDIDENTYTSNSKPERLHGRKVKRSLEFVASSKETGRSCKVPNALPQRAQHNKIHRNLFEYANEKGMLVGLECVGSDVLVHAGKDNDVTLITSSEMTSIQEVGTEKEFDEDLVTENYESQSILSNVADNPVNDKSRDRTMRKSGKAVEEKASETEKENNYSSFDCELLDQTEKSTGRMDVEDSIILVDEGVSQSSSNSVIVITSDSEKTQHADSQMDEIERERLKAVDQLFNDTEPSSVGSQVQGLSENGKAVNQLFNDTEPSSVGSQVQGLSKDGKAVNQLFNDTEPSSVGSQVQGLSENAESDSGGKSEDEHHVNTRSVPDNVLRVIKWQPNIRNIRKRKLHETLSRFLEGMKM